MQGHSVIIREYLALKSNETEYFHDKRQSVLINIQRPLMGYR